MALYGDDCPDTSDGISVLKCLSTQRDLKTAISTLKTTATHEKVSREDLLLSIADIESCMPTVNACLVDGISPQEFATYCPPHAKGLAQKVFDIPELLEMILEHLNAITLLGAQEVNRQFHDAVNASTKLQKKLWLVP